MDDYKYSKVIIKKEEEAQHIQIANYQNGVIRTNCMDCLDRTNVVQSVIARNILLTQLYQVSDFHRTNCSFLIESIESETEWKPI